MITNFFKKSSPSVTAFLLIGLLIIYAFFVAFKVVVFDWLSISSMLFFMFALVQSNRKNHLTFDNSYSLLFLVILIALFPQMIKFNRLFVINLLLLIVFDRIYSLQFLKDIKTKVFDAGFTIGIIFIFEPLTVLFLILLYTAIIIHGRAKINILILPFLAFFIPSFLFFSYCFFIDDLSYFKTFFQLEFHFSKNLFTSPVFIYNFIFVSVFVLLSVFYKSINALSRINSFRISWILLLIHFVIASVIFLCVGKGEQSLLYVIFPIAIMLSNGLELIQKKAISDVILIVLMINILIVFV